jgi:hypothetical protein
VVVVSCSHKSATSVSSPGLLFSSSALLSFVGTNIPTLNMNTLWSLFGKGSNLKTHKEENINTDSNNGLPVPNHTLSYWRSELHPIDSYCSSEDLPSSCDIAIIGAGMTGVSTAYHLSRLHAANPSVQKPSIVILDAREVCSGATGRNGVELTIPKPCQLETDVSCYRVIQKSKPSQWKNCSKNTV